MNHNECDRLIDYFNGELSLEEEKQFEDHLNNCLECQQELEEFNTLHENLPFASEPIDPPEGMKDRVLENVFANDPKPSEDETKAEDEVGEGQSDRNISSINKYASRRNGQKKQTLFYSIAAVLFLSLVGNVYLLTERGDTADPSNPSDPPVEESENQTDQLVQSVSLNATEVMDATGRASILENDNGRSLLVQADNLEAVSGEEAYQVWLLQDDQPYRAGTFVPSEEGSGAVSFNLDDLEDVDYDTVAITLEPTPNSETPQGEILLAAGL